jgi:hypothetical protein
MALDSLTAKANVGAGTDVLAGKTVGGKFAGAVVILDDTGAEIGESNPLSVEIVGSIPVTIASAIEITNDAGNAIPVQGTFWQATQPVSGSFWQATQPVSLADLPLPTGAATEATLATVAAAIKAEDAAHVSGDMGVPMFAMRQAADTTSTSDDGDYTILKIDEEGRLKVSSKPASYSDITGDITAIQATIGTPVAGGTVEGDVSRASNVMVFCTGTFSTVNCTFEGSLEASGDTNWFGVQAVRSNANTIELATGNLSAQPAYAWELSVNALKRLRVRATARTSGTQSWRFVQGTYATEPIPAAQASATQAVSGTVTATVTPPAPATPYFVNSAATTNGALILTGTSSVHSLWATNEGASPAYVKLYNKATAPTVGTDIPEMTIPIPAAASGVPGVANPNMGFIPFRFALGLGIAITRNAVHTDTTAIGAGEVKVKLSRAV